MFTRLLGIALGAILAFAAIKYMNPDFDLAMAIEVLGTKFGGSR